MNAHKYVIHQSMYIICVDHPTCTKYVYHTCIHMTHIQSMYIICVDHPTCIHTHIYKSMYIICVCHPTCIHAHIYKILQTGASSKQLSSITCTYAYEYTDVCMRVCS